MITDWIKAIERDEDISMRAFGSGRLPDDIIDALIAGFNAFLCFNNQAIADDHMELSGYHRTCYEKSFVCSIHPVG
jgi:hypothetical protein